MTPSSDRLLGPLLEILLAARSQPAADQFDDTVAAAVQAGELSADLARQLRYWQRASVHEVSDHVRTVLPIVLPDALAAVAVSEREAAAAVAAASDVWSGRHDPATAETADESGVDVPPSAQAVVSGPDVIALSGDADPSEDDRDSQQARRRMFVTGLTSTA